ncbi:fused MFS/spermidine synthase [Terriglobus albidus]|nr:fused MFS/spermidine synthase [Terriglobus albidus]
MDTPFARPMTKRPLFALTIFLGAFLLFLVEPLAARQLLPALGGSSAVWITCLVVFQLLLLFGYTYAHWLTRLRMQRGVHLGLLAAAVLLAFVSTTPGSPAAFERPITTIFLALGSSIGLPFLLLSATSPLLQVWLARSEGEGVRYRLFALSNVGSLLALLAYPVLIEPHMSLHTQRIAWAAGFVVYAALCAMLVPASSSGVVTEEAAQPVTRPATGKLVLWFLLPFAASMQLAAVTAHLSQNIAPIPLLWILPLSAYLLSFITAFEFGRFYQRGLVIRFLVVFLAALAYTLTKEGATFPIWLSISFYLIELFLACYFCHAELYLHRPEDPQQSTLFYLTLSAGGAAGTFFIGIVSPLVFSANYDLAISFFVTAVVACVALWQEGWAQRLLWATASVLLLFLIGKEYQAFQAGSMAQVRNFYGPLRVTQGGFPPSSVLRTLYNGTIKHGTQIFTPDHARVPVSYYSPDSGIGLAMRYCCKGRPKSVGVIGLGSGSLAVYAQPGDRFRFYEINPAVEPITRNLFTYLRDAPIQIPIIAGDARISLQHEAPNNFDILVIDAFSGDAIPLHLITTQALELYRKHMAPGGIIAFHVSNQYLHLAPEVAALAKTAGLDAVLISSPNDEKKGYYSATWVLLTNRKDFQQETDVVIARSSFPEIKAPAWTDDYSSILPLMNWGKR